MLDWGCGHGTDVEHLKCDGYDPHFQPELPLGVYDTILCTYVLNTIPGYFDRAAILEEAIEYLKIGGWIYVSVRKGANLNGWTSRNTWQGYVGDDLKRGGFTLLRGTSDMEIWGWQKTPQE